MFVVPSLTTLILLSVGTVPALARQQAGQQTQADADKPEFPFGKFSGLMFGDYYWYYRWHQDQISNANPTSVEGQQGFWMRRMYLAYDYSYNERLTMRLRFEANSNGQFAGGNLDPFIKDAYLKWTYHAGQQVTIGIQPTLAFDWLEGFWGLRHIEKTPVDLYRIDTARDFGVTASGPVAVDGLRYAVQFGNDSGNGSEVNVDKAVRVEGRFERKSGIALQGFYGYMSRPNGEDRYTAQGIAGYRHSPVRVGGMFVWQERKSGATGTPNQTINVQSGFVVWDVLSKADTFLRVDHVSGHRGGVETGLPGADGIDYWLLSPNSPFTTWIAGGEWRLLPNVRMGPNVELFKYSHDPDPITFPGRDLDAQFKVTFFWSF
jgi:hypothetical protein